MNDHKRLAILALRQMQGDDLARCTYAFRNCAAEPMQEKYGESGKTRAQVHADYVKYHQKVEDAIAWVESLGAT